MCESGNEEKKCRDSDGGKARESHIAFTAGRAPAARRNSRGFHPSLKSPSTRSSNQAPTCCLNCFHNAQTRMLTAWFYTRALLARAGDESGDEAVRKLTESFSTQQPVVPAIVSSLYFLSGITLILVTVWGLVSTAWWMLPLGVLSWYLVHMPYREVMESWASFQRALMVVEDTDALLKGGLTTEQERAIRKRLGMNE